MREATLLTLAAVLTLFGCARKATTSSAKWPAEAYGNLTEAEMAQFIKILPTFSAAAKAAAWKPPAKGNEGAVGLLAPLVEGMNVAGMDESLKKVGSDWKSVRLILYKIMAAHTASAVDAWPPGFLDQVKKDTSAGAKKAYPDMLNIKAVCASVPAANKEIVKNHEQDLMPLRTLNR
ncbi:MAG TPA: hypothetical protein VMH22_14205 [bacterium]|nr:hypothetical protein [bacterium]